MQFRLGRNRGTLAPRPEIGAMTLRERGGSRGERASVGPWRDGERRATGTCGSDAWISGR